MQRVAHYAVQLDEGKADGVRAMRGARAEQAYSLAAETRRPDLCTHGAGLFLSATCGVGVGVEEIYKPNVAVFMQAVQAVLGVVVRVDFQARAGVRNHQSLTRSPEALSEHAVEFTNALHASVMNTEPHLPLQLFLHSNAANALLLVPCLFVTIFNVSCSGWHLTCPPRALNSPVTQLFGRLRSAVRGEKQSPRQQRQEP